MSKATAVDRRRTNLGCLAILDDSLLQAILSFFSAKDLLSLQCASAVLYVHCSEEPLWHTLCVRKHGGYFLYKGTWKVTTLLQRNVNVPRMMQRIDAPGFTSDFLYRRWYRSHVSLRDYEPDVELVERRPIISLNLKEFSLQYDMPGMPVVLSDALQGWDAVKSWTLPGLIESCGPKTRFQVSHTVPDCGDKCVTMSMPEYAEYISAQRDECPHYVFDAHFGEKAPHMLRDYSVDLLRLFPDDLLACMGEKARPNYRWFVLGPERSGAPWHTDPNCTSAWNALISGRKRWALYPPGPPPPGVVGDGYDPENNADYDTENFESPPSLNWYLEVYPTLSSEQRPLEIVQRAGDVVYIPSGWWHMVLNLETTVSVTQNFVTRSNLGTALADLAERSMGINGVLKLHDTMVASNAGLRRTLALLRLPFEEGYTSASEYIASFHEPLAWAARLERVLSGHRIFGYNGTKEKQREQPDVERGRCVICTQKVHDKSSALALSRLTRFFGHLEVFTSRANPIFSLGNKVVVKFFSHYRSGELNPYCTSATNPFFGEDGEHTFQAESFVLDALEKHNALSAGKHYASEERRRYYPRVLGKGRLFHPEFDTWSWPYIIMERLPGISLAKVWQQQQQQFHDPGDRLHRTEAEPGILMGPVLQRAAVWLGNSLREVHEIGSCDENDNAMEVWVTFLEHQRFGAAGRHWRRRVVPYTDSAAQTAVPYSVLQQINIYLPTVENGALRDELLTTSSPPRRLKRLHGDLHPGNIVGFTKSTEYPNELATTTNLPTQLTHQLAEQSCNCAMDCSKPNNIASWLRRVLSDVRPATVEAAIKNFEDEDITPRSVCLLTEADLRALGLTLGPRAMVLKAAELEKRKVEKALSDFSSNRKLTKLPNHSAFELSNWTPSALLDFGDSRQGDPLYDLVALYIGSFHCDKSALSAFLDAYSGGDVAVQEQSFGPTATFARRAMCLTLLHPGDALRCVYRFLPEARNAGTLEELADLLWNLEADQV